MSTQHEPEFDPTDPLGPPVGTGNEPDAPDAPKPPPAGMPSVLDMLADYDQSKQGAEPTQPDSPGAPIVVEVSDEPTLQEPHDTEPEAEEAVSDELASGHTPPDAAASIDDVQATVEPSATSESSAEEPTPATDNYTDSNTDESTPSADDPAPDDPAPDAADNTASAETPTSAARDGSFAALGLRDELVTTLAQAGYEEPTAIQSETIPVLLGGRDVLGQAATGTGKTASFALPILDAINPGRPSKPVALVLCPTRELANQVNEAMFKYGRSLGVRTVPVFGGQPIRRQFEALDRGCHVVVATPGRAIDHINRGSLVLDDIQTVVLDEADEMLDMGFTEDIEQILDATPTTRQTVLFSATVPPRIAQIAKQYQNDPVHIRIGTGKATPGNENIRQSVYFVARQHKPSALGRILDIESPDATIVFCRTRTEVDELTVTMNGRGYRAEALHGGMDQNQRDRVMARLRDGTAELLVATDVAARGLDVDTLTHVVNYNVPSAPEAYVHRIGRVGRAGREGVAITLAEPKQRRLLGNIERLTKQKIDVGKMPTVADLRARQIELTVNAVREALAADDLENYNAVLHGLAGEDNDRSIALAAIKLFHESTVAAIDDVEIPDVESFDKRKRRERDGKRQDGRGRGDKKPFDRSKQRGNDPDTGFVRVALGRKAGLRPGDLVGAIANHTDLVGRQIGPIKIADDFAIVGVPDRSVDTVVQAILGTTLRGKKAKARRYTT